MRAVAIWLLATGARTAAFYTGDPHVVTVRDFTMLSSQPQAVFAIEFFAGWCGHCQAFAPVWKEAAEGACAASPSLVFGAVDCAADYVLCREMVITGFPTIRLFGPGFGPTGAELGSDCAHGCWPARATLDAILATARSSAATGHGSGDASHSAPTLLSSPPVRPLTSDALLAASAASCASASAPPPKPAPLSPFRPPVEMQQHPVPLADLASAVVYGVQRELVKEDLGAAGEHTRGEIRNV